MSVKLNPYEARAKRRALIREYILLLVRSNIFSWNDIQADIVQRLTLTLTDDVRAVLTELGATGAANLMSMTGSVLGAAVDGAQRLVDSFMGRR